jgi:hypothetical protein
MRKVNYLDLQRRLHNEPFRPFRMRLDNNTAYDITEPWMVMVGQTSAVVVTRSRTHEYGYQAALDWRTVSISHMLEFSDLETEEPERKRKPA